MRVVRSPDGAVDFDSSGKAAGRGAYLCADGSCWTTALKRGALERALHTSLPATVRARLEAMPTDTIPNHSVTSVEEGAIRGT